MSAHERMVTGTRCGVSGLLKALLTSLLEKANCAFRGGVYILMGQVWFSDHHIIAENPAETTKERRATMGGRCSVVSAVGRTGVEQHVEEAILQHQPWFAAWSERDIARRARSTSA